MVPWWGPLGSGSLSEVWRREGIWEMAGRKRNRAQAQRSRRGRTGCEGRHCGQGSWVQLDQCSWAQALASDTSGFESWLAVWPWKLLAHSEPWLLPP